ncbi:FixH family protein [Niabella beijingensis]|uniref:FixH family protein n=1 Tax=Niabella beijingensis TaxID=2872700 RepID=UPI001CBDCDC5|nr:FixH family protein [Niabella beijingensis]MBZ4191063.1 FixH family protein [Niabella beijingensis]
MNWGYRIIIALVLFLAGMIFMVQLAMRQTNETIDADYYNKELKYQQVIDGKKRLAALQGQVQIRDSSGGIWIYFPEDAVRKLDSGKIEFLRLSGSAADRSIVMEQGGKQLYTLPRTLFVPGWYKVRMAWEDNGNAYYHEQSFKIP